MVTVAMVTVTVTVMVMVMLVTVMVMMMMMMMSRDSLPATLVFVLQLLPDPVLLKLLSPLPPPLQHFPPAPHPPFASCCSVPIFALPGLFLALASSDARLWPVCTCCPYSHQKGTLQTVNRQQLLATDGCCLDPACSTLPGFVVVENLYEL